MHNAPLYPVLVTFTDYVCAELEHQGVSCFRMNCDRFDKYNITYDVNNAEPLICKQTGKDGVPSGAPQRILFACPSLCAPINRGLPTTARHGSDARYRLDQNRGAARFITFDDLCN